MSKLPEYLCFATNGAALPESFVCCGDVRITAITPRLIRLEQGSWTDKATMAVLHRDFCPCLLTVEEKSDLLTVQTEYLEIQYRPGTALEDSLTIRETKGMGFFWKYGQKPLQNLGGTISTLDGVDGTWPISDGICAIDGFATMDDSKSPLFDEEGWLIPRAPGTDVYFFGYGHDYTACVQDYYRLTGKPQMLPAFVFGNWWSRYHAYSAREYLDLMDEFQRNDVPLSVGIVDMDWHLTSGEDWKPWHNGWTGYTWNRELFPDPAGFIQGLHNRNLRTALNLHPAVGIQCYEQQYEEFAKEMGIDPATGETVPCDYLNPAFLKPYFEKLHFPYERDGVDFWWMDWQQGSSYAAIMGKHYRPNGLENVEPLWMFNHMHYLAAQREGKRPLIFSRFSGFGSQRYPIGFSGDTVITWDSLDFQPYFTVTASNIGYGWWSHDIGGHYHGQKDDELTVRWIQFGVFSPIFRLHSSDSFFLGREPWNYNPRARWIIEKFMRLRHQMFPYLYTMCRRDCQELLPLMRPMYHAYPEKKEAYQVKNQYLFGSELMVAPITKKADGSDLASVQVWFPEGIWIDAFSGDVYTGDCTLHILRPMEEMPVFMKAGGIVPMQAHIHGSRKLGGAEEMEVLVAAGESGSFTLYEDDGETMAYKDGIFCETELMLDWHGNSAVFRIGAANGGSRIPEKRTWKLCFRGMIQGVCFGRNGESLPSVFDMDTHTHTVVLENVPTDREVEITLVCEGDILYDNRDGRKKIMDLLVRAQCTEPEKYDLKGYLDELYTDLEAGPRRIYKNTSCAVNSLKTKIWEVAFIEMQRKKGRYSYEQCTFNR